MKILVTGTDGYIGARLAPALAERGHEVVGLDTGLYRDGWLEVGEQQSYTQIRKDIRQVTEDDVRGFDAVLHLAELSNDPLGQHDPEITYEVNHRGSVHLATICKQAGVERFVYSSSCSVYGMGSDGYRTEESEVNPQTAYAKCKILVERDVALLADDDFSPTFMRNSTAYGASPRMRFDIVLNDFAGVAWTEGQIRLRSDGMAWRPLIHVLDIADSMACVVEAPREVIHNQVFNVGETSHNYRVRDLPEIMRDVFPGCEPTYGSRDADNRSYRVSFEKIHSALPEFRCRRDALFGAWELREQFERVNLTREMYEFRAYTRLKQLKHLLETGQVDRQLFWIGQ